MGAAITKVQSMNSSRTPPAQWLKTFLVVAQRGSLSEAAKQLNLTQAAVSKHVRLLEHSYGLALFTRHARGVELGPAGRALLPKVEQAFDLLSQAGDALHQDASRVRVRLRCDATWAEAVLAKHLGEFSRLNPSVQILLSCYIWSEENSQNASDLLITYGDGDLAGYECHRLSTEYSFVVCSPDLKKRITSNPAELADIPRFVLTGHEHLWNRWEQTGGYSSCTRWLVCDSSIVSKQAAIHSQGLSMQRLSLVQTELLQQHLTRLDDINLDYNESYYLYKPSGRTLSSAEQAVWDWVITLQT